MNEHLISSGKATIIIAAHNESAVIGQTLSLLVNAKKIYHYQIIVVCNGCSDGTEKIIQRGFPSVHCLELKQASKALAIRHAESFNPGFPRLYLDADIELSSSGANNLFEQGAGQQSPALIIPESDVMMQSSDSFVKRFYQVWYSTKFIHQLGYGAGAYLVNHAGRQRFGLWPELIADDGFIRSQFNLNETHVSSLCRVKVKAPKSLFVLLKVKTRSKLGNLELRDYLKNTNHCAPMNSVVKEHSSQLKFNWIIYLSINVVALALAKWQYMRGNKTWHRDDSNR